jgi:hypothetical protein
MRHATSRLLFAYWDALRGERAAPERRQIEPGKIRQILADTFILGCGPDTPPAFRLAGTRCSALFGGDLKGTQLAPLWDPSSRAEADEIVRLVTCETVGVAAGLVGETEIGSALALELLLLPLRYRGSSGIRALGALSPTSIPSWLGLVPVVSLKVRSMKVVRSADADAATIRPGGPLLADKRSRFKVLEGGLGRER